MNSKITVTIIGVNYYPEDSAIGLYTTQKAEYLANNGFEVTIITGFPYYPRWKIFNSYRDKPLFFKETVNGVKVLRVKQYVPFNPSFVKRIIHLLSFTFGSIINLFKTSKPDIVITIVPFTTSIFLGWLLKLRYRSKLWVHIQDFEFDAAIDSGLVNKNVKSISKDLQWAEKKLLNRADITSTISQGMLNKLKEKTSTTCYYLTNWIDVSLFSKSHKQHHYLQSKKFKILYSGNIGAKQDWDLFYKLIKELQCLEDIEVIVVGDGAEKKNLTEKIKPFNFVKHYGLIPYSDLPNLLMSADAHILLQKKEVIDTVMPSKLLGMMASGKPSIVTGNCKSEVATILKESNGGFYLDENSVSEIKKSLLNLIKDTGLRKKLGDNAQEYVRKNFSKENVLSDFSNKLKNMF